MFNVTIICRSTNVKWQIGNLNIEEYTMLINRFSSGEYIVIC